MSRRNRTHKNAILQSLEQLILMSASAADADIPGSVDVAATADVGLFATDNPGPLTVSEFSEFPPADGELEFGLAATTSVMVDGAGSIEPAEGSFDENQPVVVIGPDGELFEFLPGEEIPEFLLVPPEFDPSVAGQFSNGSGIASAASGTVGEGREPQDTSVLFVGDNGELIEVKPEEGIPEEFPVSIEFMASFATGEDGDPIHSTDDVPPEELTVQFKPDGTPVVFVGAEEVPFEFTATNAGSSPVASTGGVVATDLQSQPEFFEDAMNDAEGSIGNFDENEEAFVADFEQFSSLDDLLSLPVTTVSDFDMAAASGAAESSGTNGEIFEDESTSAGDQTSGGIQTLGPTIDDPGLQLAASTGGSSSADASVLPVGGGNDASSSGAATVTIQGTEASEWIAGTDGDDVISAGAGDDEIYAPIGNNVIDGGDGDDRVIIYEGTRADYTLVSQDNGVTILEGPGLNGGNVRMELVNVESIQFNDGRVQVASLTTSGGASGGSSAITGSDDGEWIAGTSADDDIDAGAGDDEIYASLGTNKINGGTGQDTLVVYEGVRSDYLLSKAADGRIYLQGPGLNGETVRNLLTDVERIQFNDATVETADVDVLADAALLSIFN